MLGEHELQTVDVKSPPHTEIMETNMRSEHDARVLARMGKKSVLEVCAMPHRQRARSVLISASAALAGSLFWGLLAPFSLPGKVL